MEVEEEVEVVVEEALLMKVQGEEGDQGEEEGQEGEAGPKLKGEEVVVEVAGARPLETSWNLEAEAGQVEVEVPVAQVQHLEKKGSMGNNTL